VRRCGVVIALLVAAAAAGGCGSSSDDGSGEAEKVVQQLGSLQRGEILIQGMTAPRVVGPYVFKPGGYVLHFEQPGAGESEEERLIVALESTPGSRAQPYQLLVDSGSGSGRKEVSMSGKLYVHVVRAPGDYLLRFTPKPR
jgi:hypothetical protein